ncbi:MAG: hypothetical protein M3161_02435, partial [Actinomycetota bacterium]|nr:hypothetical protein [Actinomycetota bacterium]
MSAHVLGLALLQLGALAVVGRAVVALVAPLIDPEREWLGAPERWLLSIAGFAAFAATLMLVHIASGGRVFDRTWAVPLAAGLFVVAVFWRKRRMARTPRLTIAVVVLAVLLLFIYAAPALRGGSSLRTGDTPWHLGWTQQLLGGDPLPTGPAPEPFGRNAYPWGYHAVLATMVRAVPTTDPVIAQEAMHLLLIGSLPLAAACLARLVNRRAGTASAAVFALLGGFGWIAAG